MAAIDTKAHPPRPKTRHCTRKQIVVDPLSLLHGKVHQQEIQLQLSNRRPSGGGGGVCNAPVTARPVCARRASVLVQVSASRTGKIFPSCGVWGACRTSSALVLVCSMYSAQICLTPTEIRNFCSFEDSMKFATCYCGAGYWY